MDQIILTRRHHGPPRSTVGKSKPLPSHTFTRIRPTRDRHATIGAQYSKPFKVPSFHDRRHPPGYGRTPGTGFIACSREDPVPSAISVSGEVGEVLDALKQENEALLAELAQLRQPPLLVPVQPSMDPPPPRPFKDFMPNLPSYSGVDAPEVS